MRSTAVNNNSSQSGTEKYHIPAFAGLGDRELVSIYGTARTRQFAKDEVIVAEGTNWNCVGVIVSGAAGLFVQLAENATPFDKASPGDWFGPVNADQPMPFSVIALKRCTVMEFAPTAFQHLTEKVRLTIVRALANTMSKLFAAARSEMEQTSIRINRLVSYIDTQSTKNKNYILSPFASGLLKGLPQLPQYATELAAKLLNDDTTVQEVVAGVKQDPSLASLVLKIVNSPYYGLASNISDFHRACLLLGFNNVYRVVVEAGIQSIMPNTEEFVRIQQHSYLVSLISQEIAGSSKDVSPAFATTIGLLHDIGKSAVRLLKMQRPEAEEAISMLDDVFVGAALLRNWGLPERLVNVIEHQHELEYATPSQWASDNPKELAALGLAKVFATVLENKLEEPPPASYADACLKVLGVRGFASASDFYREKIIPGLNRQKRCLPQSLREMLADDE